MYPWQAKGACCSEMPARGPLWHRPFSSRFVQSQACWGGSMAHRSHWHHYQRYNGKLKPSTTSGGYVGWRMATLKRNAVQVECSEEDVALVCSLLMAFKARLQPRVAPQRSLWGSRSHFLNMAAPCALLSFAVLSVSFHRPFSVPSRIPQINYGPAGHRCMFFRHL